MRLDIRPINELKKIERKPRAKIEEETIETEA